LCRLEAARRRLLLRDTVGMSLKTDLAANRWLRAQFAVLIFAIAYVPVAGVLSLVFGSLWALAPVPVYATAGSVCWVRARRESRVLSVARLRAEAELAELHTPRVPDAGPDQCPVCAGFGLDDLAADDAFMDRGALAKVVAYGPRRAHWDCAEFVPHKPPVISWKPLPGSELTWAEILATFDADADTREFRPTPLGFGVICTCRSCGEQKHAPNMEAAKARLIEHARGCPERGRVEARERTVAARPGWMSESEARHVADIEEARLAPCRPTAAEVAWRAGFQPDGRWLWPDPKTLRRRP
jgi:hypothetical protein